MRGFATFIIGAVCVIALWAGLAMHSVLSYIGSSEAVTETARSSDLHGLALQAGEAALIEEMRKGRKTSPKLEALVARGARTVLSEVLDEDWFYRSFRAGYGDVAVILQTSTPGSKPHRDAAVDLRDKKQELEGGLVAIAGKVEAQCVRLLGENACKGTAARRKAKADYRAAVSRSLAGIPDVLTLRDVLERAGKDWMEPDSQTRTQARQIVGIMNIVRVAALGVAFMGLLLFIAINYAPLSRLLAVVGIVFVLASGPYLIATYASDYVVEHFVAEVSLEDRANLKARDDRVGEVALQAATTFAMHATRDIFHHADSIALGLFMAGAGMLVLAVILGRRHASERAHSINRSAIGKHSR